MTKNKSIALLVIYLCIELFFQFVMMKSLEDLSNKDAIPVIEWTSRILFSLGSFIFISNTKARPFRYIAAIAAFCTTFAVFPLLKTTMSDYQKAEAILNVKEESSLSISKLMTIAFVDKGNREKLDSFTDSVFEAKEKIRENVENKFYSIKRKTCVRNCLSNMSEDAYRLAMRSGLVRDAFLEINKKSGLFIFKFNDPLEYPYLMLDKPDIKEKVLKELLSEGNGALQVALLFPIGFILSILGVIFNSITLARRVFATK